jgi:hypothetical protein
MGILYAPKWVVCSVLATRIATKICAYTYAFLVDGLLGRSQERIKDLWA